MRLPTFLIIGAMKAGTTTLYRDLLANPGVAFARDKEVGCLASDKVLSTAGTAEYARLFRNAGNATAVGDASTNYAKLPDFPGVAERAYRVVGPGLKVVYMVRDPIPRLLSQHHFESQRGWMSRDTDQAIRSNPRLLSYSKYGMQIEPWCQRFGNANIKVVQFERYISHRQETLNDVSRFLGVSPRPDLIAPLVNYNPTIGAPVVRGAWATLSRNPFYRRIIRPMLSVEARRRTRLKIVPKDRAAPPLPPSSITTAYLVEELHEDLTRFRILTGEDLPYLGGDGAR